MVAGARCVWAVVATAWIIGCVASNATAQPDLYDPTVVRTFKLTFAQPNWWSLLVNNKSSRTNIPATLEVDNQVYSNVGVRFRGNTSYSLNLNRSQKLPFNITTDAFVPNQRLYGYKNLNLANAYKDATFVREVVAYEVMRRYMPSLKCCFINLTINNENWGVYVHVQQPNADFVDDWFRNDDGNLYRGDSVRRNTRPTLTYLGSNVSSYQSQYDIKVANATPWLDLIDLCRRLNAAVVELPTRLPDVLNVDSALWYIALQNVFSNVDSYLGTGNDYLVYGDVHHGRFSVMPWDLNTSFGGYDWRGLLGAQGLKTMSPYYKGASSDARPLITQLLAVPEWKQRYLAHVRTVLDEVFDWNTIGPVIRAYHKQIEPLVLADGRKLYSTQKFYDNLTKDVVVSDRTGSFTIPGLQSFVDTKRAYLLAHPDIAVPTATVGAVTTSPAQPRAVDTVWVTATVTAPVPLGRVRVFHRVRGRFAETPMFDDGLHRDGAANDGVYGASLTPQPAATEVQYYVAAETAGGALTFEPRRASFAPLTYRVEWGSTAPSALRISEFVAKNDSGIRDEASEREDWIELVNTGAVPVSLGGRYLTDDVTNPTKWRIPDGQTLAPGATLLVWADEDSGQGPLHANFKLAAGGEEVALFDVDGKTLLDWFAFGPQQPDMSTGRPAGHFGVTTTFPQPTPRTRNRAEPCGHLLYAGRNPAASRFALLGLDAPNLGATVRYSVLGAPATTAGWFALAPAPLSADLNGFGTLLVDPAAMVAVPFVTDTTGAFTQTIGVPNAPALSGLQVFAQAYVGGLSNGVATRICP